MQQEAEVLTGTDTEDSPPETSDSTLPEETGQEVATPEGEVGVEETEVEKPPYDFHKHPDFADAIEGKRASDERALQAEAEARVLRDQLHQTQAAPVEEPKRWSEAELEQKVYDGEITERQATSVLARQEAQDVVFHNEGQRAVTESNHRAMKLVPDLGTSGSEGQRLFMQLATTDFRSLYDQTTGEPTVWDANEMVARETKRRMDVQGAAGRSKASEDQRRAAIDSQGTETGAPHGRGAEEDMSDSIGKLTPDQKDHLQRQGRLNEQGARDYLKYAGSPESPSKAFPEKARRPGG